jgi:hypothetical protein
MRVSPDSQVGGFPGRKKNMVRTSSVVVVLVSAAVLGGSLLLVHGATEESRKPDGFRVYEQRTYYTNPGKIEALHARFREHTNHLFVKHGMTLVGYWTPQDDKDTLVYLLAYPSMDARKKSWDGFMNDPEWKAAQAASEVDGRLVSKIESRFLIPTDYSPAR